MHEYILQDPIVDQSELRLVHAKARLREAADALKKTENALQRDRRCKILCVFSSQLPMETYLGKATAGSG